ncbi:MAG: hypothetical protein ACRC9K_08075 [Afipia sp.]
MKYKLLCSGVFAASLAVSTGALAQSVSTVSPATPPTLLAPLPMGNNTSGVNQPGVPNTSTPGLIGTGATPSGLIGDSTHHPGFPGRHPK